MKVKSFHSFSLGSWSSLDWFWDCPKSKIQKERRTTFRCALSEVLPSQNLSYFLDCRQPCAQQYLCQLWTQGTAVLCCGWRCLWSTGVPRMDSAPSRGEWSSSVLQHKLLKSSPKALLGVSTDPLTVLRKVWRCERRGSPTAPLTLKESGSCPCFQGRALYRTMASHSQKFPFESAP